ncbi:MAG: hypothetical protein JXQ75_15360 [Phycisphaerae bacterium]|nr:hypothetical protein [Phycisphaerae bacterium]
MTHDSVPKLEIRHQCAGRALHARPDGTLYVGRKFDIYRSNDDGRTWTFVASMPRSFGRRLAEASRLACRLLRHEVKALAALSDGTHVACNRQWVYYARPGDRLMCPSAVDEQDGRLFPSMTITVGPEDRVIWGEYNSKTGHNLPMRLYVSDDRGRSYQVAHVFDGGSILHVHNLFYDERLRHYWVFTGDHDHEPGIGCLSADLKHFEWVCRGDQRYRAVEVFDFGDHLIYGMDTEMEANAVVRFDKATGRVERLQELDGGCIYACRFGGLYVLSTTVEPSKANASKQASLWVSRDGEHWSKAFGAEKDGWHPVYFQFGSLVLPRGASGSEVILFSGQALKGIDGKAMAARLTEPP